MYDIISLLKLMKVKVEGIMFANLKIRTKIIILCVSIIIVNSSATGYLYYNYAFKDTLKNTYTSSEDIIYQVNNYITDKLGTIIRSVHAMFNNVSFTLPLSDYLNNPSSKNYTAMLGYAADSLTELCQADKYIHSAYIYTKYSDFNDFSKTKQHDFEFTKSVFYKQFEKDPTKTIAWFPAMQDQIFVGNEIVIPIVFRFQIFGSRENIYLLVNLNQSTFMDYLDTNFVSVDKLFIVDSDGNNIVNYGDNEKLITEFFTDDSIGSKTAICNEVTYQGEVCLVAFSKIRANNWELYSIKSKSDLLRNLEALRTFLAYILLFGVFISIILIVLFAIGITSPINQLAKIMRKAYKEEFHVQFNYPYNNEVGDMADSFNHMIGEINHLIFELNFTIEALKEEKENVRNVQRQKRIAELKALQAQINPHFLYNTLNAITWQATDQGSSEISILSNSLGKFFRLSLSKGNEVITLKDEIEHVRNYLDIQMIRYKSKLNYQIDVENELLNVPMIKLILQPLVENSIYHGIKLKDIEGYIRIYVTKHMEANGLTVIKICVEDNGNGIAEEKLRKINSSLMEGNTTQKEGYGIYNVNERIKLYYGESYGLMFESKFGEWTRATIIIPTQITEVD